MQVILDTNIIYSLIDKDDSNHLRIKRFFQENNDFLYILPSTIIIEICYLVRTRLSPHLEIKFLEEVKQNYKFDPIKDEDISKLFEPFQQLESSYTKKHEGTGLGLGIAHQILCAHGGTISVTSEPGAGTAFTVRLPIATENADS